MTSVLHPLMPLADPYEEIPIPLCEEDHENALPPALVPPAPQGLDLDPTTLAQHMVQWTQTRVLLTTYMRQHMTEGIDYYTLRIHGKPTKPALSKAGSEKFLSLFNLQARFRKDDETWEMLGRPAGVLCYVCALYTKQGTFVGEGRGAREVAKDQDMNKAIKMAQKSAQIDATLRTAALSDSFTQDLEDQLAPDLLLVQQQKRQIVALLKAVGLEAIDKAGYEAAVEEYTELALIPEHYPEIIRRLEAYLQTRPPHGGRGESRAEA